MKKIINYGILISVVYSIGLLLYLIVCKIFNNEFVLPSLKNTIGVITIFMGLMSLTLIILSKIYLIKIWAIYELLFYEILIYAIVIIIFGIAILFK